MNGALLAVVATTCLAAWVGGCSPAAPPLEPAVVPLREEAHYQPVLEGAPRTRGMESGRVVLPPWQMGELHGTKSYEEAITILSGVGELRVTGQAARPFRAPCVVYVPPDTEHALANTGAEPLVYVFVAAPTRR